MEIPYPREVRPNPRDGDLWTYVRSLETRIEELEKIPEVKWYKRERDIKKWVDNHVEEWSVCPTCKGRNTRCLRTDKMTKHFRRREMWCNTCSDGYHIDYFI